MHVPVKVAIVCGILLNHSALPLIQKLCTITFLESEYASTVKDSRSKRGSIEIAHSKKHEKIRSVRSAEHAGRVSFSQPGTTERQFKAMMHDLTLFKQAVEELQRPTLQDYQLLDLQFDHIAEINTLLHTLFNKGNLELPDYSKSRSVKKYPTCAEHEIEVHDSVQRQHSLE